jgi:signal transduction histidine kinase
MEEQHYTSGKILFREGDMGDAMYIVRSGRVAIVKGDFKSPTVLGFRGAGEVIGEMALLEDRPRSASIVVFEDLNLLRISRENFKQFLSSDPVVGMSILSMLSTQLRAAGDALSTGLLAEKRLTRKVSDLQTEKQQLLELQRLRQETTDLIIHDLRSPLTLISGTISMLEMTLPEDVLQVNREILNLANANCQRMKLLVDSLLDVTRMESGEAQLTLTKTNLGDLINKAVDRIAAYSKKYDIAVQRALSADLPTLTIDEEKIDRVLANLIDNAIKHTPDGGEITIAAEKQDRQAVVSVTNTGPTIPPEDRQRVFRRFSRRAKGKSRTQGFGLGLAFCRLAVEAHGGKIWVEPKEDGTGNSFIFRLPLSPKP